MELEAVAGADGGVDGSTQASLVQYSHSITIDIEKGILKASMHSF